MCPHSRGTERQHVANDYAKRLHMGSVECQTLVQDVVGAIMSMGTAAVTPPNLVFCEYLNVSVCPAVEKETSVSLPSTSVKQTFEAGHTMWECEMICSFQFNVVVYNPLLISAPLTLWVPQDIELSSAIPTVQDGSGKQLAVQV